MFGGSNQQFPVQPIVSLTPYLSNKWWIKARVVDKSDIRRWSKPNSEGQLFSCSLVDESGAIRATFFQEAVDKFFNMLTPGSVYYISGGSLKTANRKFNNVNNEYEMSLDKEANIQQTGRGDNSSNIPTQRYNFVPISLLMQREKGSLVDLLGVVTGIGDVGKVTVKASGQELVKRSVTIADTTAAVELTAWGNDAERWSSPIGSVLAVKNVRISTFDGVSVSMSMQSGIDQNPNIPEVRKLQQWYASTEGKDVHSLTGGQREFTGETKRKFFDDIEREGLGKGDKPEYIEVRCMPTFIKTDALWYDSCPKCQKKVQESAQGSKVFRCEKCDGVVNPEPRYLCSVQCSDNVSQRWVTMFNEAGLQFFGVSAKEMKEKAEQDSTYLSREVQKRLYTPMLCRLRVKEERYGDNPDANIRLSAIRVSDFWHEYIVPVAADGKESALTKECNNILECIAAYHH